jgi:hypothetical protein
MNQVESSLSFFGPGRNIFSVFELGSGARKFCLKLDSLRVFKVRTRYIFLK